MDDKKNSKQQCSKYEFSKKIALTVTYTWIATIIYSAIVFYIKSEVSSEIITTTSTALGVVITGYFGKAGFENYHKNKDDNSK